MTSLGLWVARQVVRLGRDPKLASSVLKKIYNRRAYPAPAQPTWRARRALDIHRGEHQGHLTFELHLKGHARSTRRLLYLHGGGFVRPLHWAHWDACTSLARATGAQVTLPTYPLCPEHSLDECHEHLLSLYTTLAQRSDVEELIIAGDSAGGNLALCLALQALQVEGAQLRRLILFCPWVDLGMSNPEVDDYAARDPMLTRSTLEEWGRWWSGARALSDPLVSPLYADLRGLPPTDIFLGEDDMLTPDGLALAQAMERAGVEVQQDVTPRAFHDFMAVTFTPEAKAVYRSIKERVSPLGR